MELVPSAAEWFLLSLELVLVALAVRGGGIRSRQPGVVACCLAICLAWAVRLGLHALLFSNGFIFFWVDDLIRFVQAYEWSRHPSFLALDTPWMPGTQYLHGFAMRFIRDPLLASKIAAAASDLACLVGLFLFSDGVFRDRRIAAATVVAAGPWWLVTLLGTGALAEVPACGFVMSGIGLFFYARDNRGGLPRAAMLALSAGCLGASTTFHVLAWVHVAPVLIGAAIAWAAERKAATGWSLCTAALFCAGVSLFPAAYLVEAWMKKGDPLFFMVEHRILERPTGISPGWVYPYAIAFSVLPWSVALLGGIAKVVSSRARARQRPAAVLVGILATLAVMIVTSFRYGTTPTPYRSTVLLTMALLPFALSVFFSSGEPDRPEPRRAHFVALLALGGLMWGIANVTRIWDRQRLEDTQTSLGVRRYHPSAFALGAFLREEFREGQPMVLTRDNLREPIRVLFVDLGAWREWIDWLIIVNRAGNPGAFVPTWWEPLETQFDLSELSSVKVAQLVLLNRPIRDQRFREVISFEPYRLYERTNPPR